jgi:protoporphyrinogen oxidase
MKIQTWTYPEVAKVLDDKRSASDVAKEMESRTAHAVSMVRGMAGRFQRGKNSNMTKSMRNLFEAYFEDKNMVSKKKEEKPMTLTMPTPMMPEKSKTEMMMEQIDRTYNSLKDQIVALSDALVEDGNEKIMAEVKELRTYKQNTEKEMEELKTFRDKAQKSNLLSMFRGRHPKGATPAQV